MTNFFLAIFPDQKANYRIRKVMAQAGALFDSHGVPIRLTNPEQFHITLLYIGKKLPWTKQKIIQHKLKKEVLPSFDITTGKIRLGISRNYRELLFLTIDGGAEPMRNMVYNLAPKLKIKRDHMFIPHIPLGRVSKDLTDEEFKNLGRSIHKLNEQIQKDLEGITWPIQKIELIRSQEGQFTTLDSFTV